MFINTVAYPSISGKLRRASLPLDTVVSEPVVTTIIIIKIIIATVPAVPHIISFLLSVIKYRYYSVKSNTCV